MQNRLKELYNDLAWAIKLTIGDKIYIAVAVCFWLCCLGFVLWGLWTNPLPTIFCLLFAWFVMTVYERYNEIQEWKKDLPK
jgi:hypothetical protein